MPALSTHRRNAFTAVFAVAWLGIVGLLTFVFPACNRYTGRVVAISEGAQVVVLRDGRPQSLRLAELVKAGLAWPSTLRASRSASTLTVLQTRAMSDRRGLWAEVGRQPVLSAARSSRVSSSHAVVSPAGDTDPDPDADLDETEGAPATERGAPAAALGEN